MPRVSESLAWGAASSPPVLPGRRHLHFLLAEVLCRVALGAPRATGTGGAMTVGASVRRSGECYPQPCTGRVLIHRVASGGDRGRPVASTVAP